MAVVDASVVVDWVAPDADPHGPAAMLLNALAATDEPLRGPELLLHEVGNALLTGVRRGRWDGAQADGAFRLLACLPVSLVAPVGVAQRAWDLSRRYDQHPLYDMVYVATAELLADTFYTADAALVRRVSPSSKVALVA